MASLESLKAVIRKTEIPRTEVGMDYDGNCTATLCNLPSATTLPKEMSDDRAFIETKSVDGAKAVCAEFHSEVGGVMGEKFTTCLTEEGTLVTLNKDGARLSGSETLAGKVRQAWILAQTVQSYYLQSNVSPFAKYLMDNAGNIDPRVCGLFMKQYQPFVKAGMMPVDVDQDKEGRFPPTVGTATATPGMVNDWVYVAPMQLPVYGASIMFGFKSEVNSPYGIGAPDSLFDVPTAVLTLAQNCDLKASSVNGELSQFDRARMYRNIGNTLNANLSPVQPLAQEIVANASALKVPANVVARNESMESMGSWARRIEAARDTQREVIKDCTSSFWSSLTCSPPAVY